MSAVFKDWAQSFGLETREEGGIGSTLKRHGLGQTLPKPNRVYGHRTGAAFVRVAPGGFVYLANLHGREISNGQSGERGSSSRVGKRPQQTLLDDLRRLVVVAHFVQELTNTVVERALEPLFP